MQLRLETDYAIRCLLYLADGHDGASSSQIGEAIGLSQIYAQKILSNLRSKGFVLVTRGSRGGYSLAKDTADIGLLDVINRIEGTIAINRCVEPDGYCNRNAAEYCPMHVFYEDVQNLLEDVFGAVSLKDIKEKSYELPVVTRA